MKIEEIGKAFEKEGLGISRQAAVALVKLDNVESHIAIIVKQLKARNLVIGGGDIIKYLLTGTISDSLNNSGDVI